jgi:hypothetical protein
LPRIWIFKREDVWRKLLDEPLAARFSPHPFQELSKKKQEHSREGFSYPCMGKNCVDPKVLPRAHGALSSLHCEPQKLALLVFGNPSRSASICFAN